MVRISLKTIKGKRYAYFEESFRMGSIVRNVSKYIGPAKDVGALGKEINKENMTEKINLFKSQVLLLKTSIRSSIIQRKIKKLEYPLSSEEIEKIEAMNLKYVYIMNKLHPKEVEDLNKRFIANYVFESNAMEGNSLTLKNVAEIVFENRISTGKDLREIYDAQNSYNLFLYLQKTRKEITHDFIIDLHARLMDRIDTRLGYRKVPIVLLGKPNTKLAAPELVHQEMDALIRWYNKSKDTIYPLELALKFHAKFEKIHPFSDGKGRVGRFLLNYILMRKGYFPIIIRKTTRNNYIKALEAADRNRMIVLMRYGLKHYKETFNKFYEVYYKYASSKIGSG